jgi:hypothetical protein
MVLIEFWFKGKNIMDQEFRSTENMVTKARFVALIVFILGGTSTWNCA